MTLTMSLTWVARFTLPSMRCERSPNPVIVGVNTLCPRFCRRSATRRQHQPPCQAPCTSTKVFGALVCAAAGVPPKAAAPAPAPALASTPRRVIAPSWVAVIVSSLRVVCCFVWLNLTWGASVRSERGATQLCDLDENLRQTIRHVDHGVVAARQLVDAPRGVGLEPLLHAVERDAGVALGADIGLFGDALARAGDRDLVGERRKRMRRAHGIDPAAVGLVHPERRCRHRLHDGLAFCHRGGDRFAYRLRRFGRQAAPFSGTKASRNMIEPMASRISSATPEMMKPP